MKNPLRNPELEYVSNVLVKVQATDRAKLMLMALDAGMGQSDTHL
jgi:hypothetical protein